MSNRENKFQLVTEDEIELLIMDDGIKDGYEEKSEEISVHSAKELIQEHTKFVNFAMQKREKRHEDAIEKINMLYSDENFDLDVLEIYLILGDWCVTNFAMLRLDVAYMIAPDRIFDRDWLYVGNRKGVNMFDFFRCLLYARVKYAPSQQILH